MKGYKRKSVYMQPDTPDFDFDCLSEIKLPEPKPIPAPKQKRRKKVASHKMTEFFTVLDVKRDTKEEVEETKKEVTKEEVVTSIQYKPLVTEPVKRLCLLTSLDHAKASTMNFHEKETAELTSFIESQKRGYDDVSLYEDLRLLIVHGPSSCGKSWCVQHVSKSYEFEVLDMYDNSKNSKNEKSEDSSSLQDLVRDALCIPSDEAMFSDDPDAHPMRIVCVEDVDTLEDHRMQAIVSAFKLSHKDLWPLTPKEKRSKFEDLRRPTNVLILTATNLYTHSMGILKNALFLPRKRSVYKEIALKPLNPNQCKMLCKEVCEKMQLQYHPELVDLYYENPSHLLGQLELLKEGGSISETQGCLDEVRGSGNPFQLMKDIFNPEGDTSIHKYESWWDKVGDNIYAHVWNNYLSQGPKIGMVEDCLEHMSGMADIFEDTLGTSHSDTDFMLMLGTKTYHTGLIRRHESVCLKRAQVTWHEPNTLVKWGSARKGEKVRGTGIGNLSTRSDWEVARAVSTIHRLHQEKKMEDVTNFKVDPRYNIRYHLGSYHTLKSTKVFHKVKEVLKLRKAKKGVYSIGKIADIVWCHLPWEDRYLERNEYELDEDFQKSSSKKASKKRSTIKDAEREIVKNHVLTNAFKLLSKNFDYDNKKAS